MTSNKSRYFTDQFAALGDEISRLMIACDIDIDGSDDLAERILKNDASVCGRHNSQAFEKLRHHLLALYPLEERSIERIGAEQTQQILEAIRAHLRELRSIGRPGHDSE